MEITDEQTQRSNLKIDWNKSIKQNSHKLKWFKYYVYAIPLFAYMYNYENKNRFFCLQYPLHVFNVLRWVATSISWLYVLLLLLCIRYCCGGPE